MNRRYYQVGGITIQVESDLPFQETTFLPKFGAFRVNGPGEDTVSIRHHFSLPDPPGTDEGELLYRKPPWVIRRNGATYTYQMVGAGEGSPIMTGVFSRDYARGEIYSSDDANFRRGNLGSLTMFPTDQVLLSPLAAERGGFLLHAAGMVIDGKGLLFIGHSEAGKSTTVTMLREMGEILCDDRILVRPGPDGFSIHGTWSHGTVSEVSPGSAPLLALMILEKSGENRIVPLPDRGEVLKILPRYTIRSLVTSGWWVKTIDALGRMTSQVPAYRLCLDRSGKVRESMRDFLESR